MWHYLVNGTIPRPQNYPGGLSPHLQHPLGRDESLVWSLICLTYEPRMAFQTKVLPSVYKLHPVIKKTETASISFILGEVNNPIPLYIFYIGIFAMGSIDSLNARSRPIRVAGCSGGTSQPGHVLQPI